MAITPKKKSKKHAPLVTVAFKADEKTLAGIATLEKALVAAAGPGEIPIGTKSTVIRKAIQESADRLDPANYER